MKCHMLALFIGASLAFASDARADFSVNDCILDGLKGVSSDAAARLVRSACEAKKQEFRRQSEAKQEEFRRQRVDELEQQYGASVSLDTVQVADRLDREGDELWAIKVANLDRQSDRIVAYVLIGISPAPGQGLPCLESKEVEVAYKVAIRPGRAEGPASYL